jgi:hypothetical protein
MKAWATREVDQDQIYRHDEVEEPWYQKPKIPPVNAASG